MSFQTSNLCNHASVQNISSLCIHTQIVHFTTKTTGIPKSTIQLILKFNSSVQNEDPN